MSSKSLWFTVALEFVFLAAAAVTPARRYRPSAGDRPGAQTAIRFGGHRKGVGLAHADGLRARVFVRCGDRVEKLHKIPICIDHKALEDAGIGTDTPVTRTIEGVSLRSALHLMLHDLGLTYVIADDVLLITTPNEANNRLMTRVYEVGDLVSCRDEKGRLWQDFGSLIEMVTTVIQPTTWDEVGGPGSIKEGLFAHSKILVVSQTADVHEELARLLEDVRKVARKHPGDGKPPLRERPAPKPAIQGAMGGGMGGFGFGMGGASSPGSMSGAGGFGFGMGGASSPGSMSGGGFGFGMGGTSSPGSMSGAGPLAVPAAKPAGDTLPGSPEADPFADPPRHKPAGKKVAEQAFGAAPGTDEPVFDTFSGKPAAKKAASKANVPAASQTPAARKPARPAGHKPFCGTPAQAAASAARKPARPAGHKPLTGVKLACGEEAVRKAARLADAHGLCRLSTGGCPQRSPTAAQDLDLHRPQGT